MTLKNATGRKSRDLVRCRSRLQQRFAFEYREHLLAVTEPNIYVSFCVSSFVNTNGGGVDAVVKISASQS